MVLSDNESRGGCRPSKQQGVDVKQQQGQRVQGVSVLVPVSLLHTHDCGLAIYHRQCSAVLAVVSS